MDHCIFKGNSATQWGGGICNIGPGTTTLVNSLFYQNTAQSGGAAFSNMDAQPKFINVTIANNTAGENGGAVHNYNRAETELTNCIVWGNKRWASSSQLYTADMGKTKVYFSVLEGGAAAIIGERESAGIVSQSPLFTDTTSGNFTLQTCSPAINIGPAAYSTGLSPIWPATPGSWELQMQERISPRQPICPVLIVLL